MLDRSTIYVPPIWSGLRQVALYRQGYAEAFVNECDAFMWAKLRGRCRKAYEAGREAGYARRIGAPAPTIGVTITIEGPQRIHTRPNLQERLDALET